MRVFITVLTWLLFIFFGLFSGGCVLVGNNTTVTKTTNLPNGTRVTETTDAPTETMVYQQQAGQHSTNESARISAQSSSIAAASNCPTCSSDAQAIIKFSATQQIANLRPTPYSGQAPTNGYDVANTLAGQATGIAGVTGWTYVGAKAVDAVGTLAKNAGDNTTVKMGDGNTVQGFDKRTINQEVHATAVGHDSVPSVNNPQAGDVPPPVEEETPEESVE